MHFNTLVVLKIILAHETPFQPAIHLWLPVDFFYLQSNEKTKLLAKNLQLKNGLG